MRPPELDVDFPFAEMSRNGLHKSFVVSIDGTTKEKMRSRVNVAYTRWWLKEGGKEGGASHGIKTRVDGDSMHIWLVKGGVRK